MAKAVALFSGGLDSTLAILTILKQGIDVKAIKFLTPFDCHVSDIKLHSYISPSPAPPVKGGVICKPSPLAGEGKGEGYANWYDRSLYHKHPFTVAKGFGFEVKLCHLSDKFIEIVKNPRFGYGRNMNPCIDCRILMLKEAKVFMNMSGADFIITGEVLGQRPMSQRKDTFYLIDREAGITDCVLRPLSAKLLKPTSPEAEGIVNRKMLYGISRRSRKPQMALAKTFGLTDFPAPAGGCLLTEPNYSYRLKDLLTHNPDPDIRDITLLSIGRHFRFSPSCKIIVGRNDMENGTIGSLSMNSDCLLEIEGCGSPTTLVTGEITDEAINVAASICARYSDAKNFSLVGVAVFKRGSSFRLKVQPADTALLDNYRIEKKSNLLVTNTNNN
jgi:tRNA-specific 2-thiouridylase